MALYPVVSLQDSVFQLAGLQSTWNENGLYFRHHVITNETGGADFLPELYVCVSLVSILFCWINTVWDCKEGWPTF